MKVRTAHIDAMIKKTGRVMTGEFRLTRKRVLIQRVRHRWEALRPPLQNANLLPWNCQGSPTEVGFLRHSLGSVLGRARRAGFDLVARWDIVAVRINVSIDTEHAVTATNQIHRRSPIRALQLPSSSIVNEPLEQDQRLCLGEIALFVGHEFGCRHDGGGKRSMKLPPGEERSPQADWHTLLPAPP